MVQTRESENPMFLNAIRRALSYQRRHAIEFNIAGAVAGLVTAAILATGFFTRGVATPTAAPHSWGWFTGPIMALLHDGGNWHLLSVALIGGIEVGVLTLFIAVRLRYFYAYRRQLRQR